VLSLTYTDRNQEQNQGTFSFYIYPPLFNIRRMTLSSCVALQCNSTYTITSLGYDRGTLSVTVDFSEDLEGRSCNLTVSYDANVIRSPDSFLAFTVQSNTTALTYFSKVSDFTRITFIFRVLS
jgi:hypothetical protein